MDTVDAAQAVTQALVGRLASGQPAPSGDGGITVDGDPAVWLAGELATESGDVLRALADAPDDPEAALAVLARVLEMAADPDFAARLLAHAAACPPPRKAEAEATVMQSPVTTVTGRRSRAFIGGRIVKHKSLLVPFAFVIRIGRKAGTVAAAHPAAAVATCTVVVATGATGAIVWAHTPPPTPTTAPIAFAGLWQGTITERGSAGYTADIAITGGPLHGTVGSANLTNLACTSTLTLAQARQDELTITDDTTSGKCANGTLVLTPGADSRHLRYVLTHPDGTVATGVLSRTQSFTQPSGPSAPSVAQPVGQRVASSACDADPSRLHSDYPPAFPRTKAQVDGTYTVPPGITAPTGAIAFQAFVIADSTKFNADPHTGLSDSKVYVLAPAGDVCDFEGDFRGSGAPSTAPGSAPAAAVEGTNVTTNLVGPQIPTSEVDFSVLATARYGLPPCSPAPFSSTAACVTDPDVIVSALPTGVDSVKAFVFVEDFGPNGTADAYGVSVANTTPAGLAEKDGFSAFAECTPQQASDYCTPNLELILREASGTAVASVGLQNSYKAITDFIAHHPLTAPTEIDGPVDTPDGLPSPTETIQRRDTDCGVMSATRASGKHIVINDGPITCDQANKVITDYEADKANWQGTSTTDHVDGMFCNQIGELGCFGSGSGFVVQ